MINLHTSVVQKPGFLATEMDGETVMMSVQAGKYYSLGAVGGVIWGIISRPQTISQIVEALLADFEIGKAQCEKEVIAFIKELTAEGLVELVKKND